MRECIREVCFLSILGGAALSLAPEGGPRRILKSLVTILLLALVLEKLPAQDPGAYRLERSKYREKEQELLDRGEEKRDELNRLVIEQEYASYVMEQAEACGLLLDSVSITVRWNTEGLWVPERAVIRLREGDADRLRAFLTDELGIPPDRQEVELCD